jgi:hypothetical protein
MDSFGPAAAKIANTIYFFNPSYLNEEVNWTELSPSVGVPWFRRQEQYK